MAFSGMCMATRARRTRQWCDARFEPRGLPCIVDDWDACLHWVQHEASVKELLQVAKLCCQEGENPEQVGPQLVTHMQSSRADRSLGGRVMLAIHLCRHHTSLLCAGVQQAVCALCDVWMTCLSRDQGASTRTLLSWASCWGPVRLHACTAHHHDVVEAPHLVVGGLRWYELVRDAVTWHEQACECHYDVLEAWLSAQARGLAEPLLLICLPTALVGLVLDFVC